MKFGNSISPVQLNTNEYCVMTSNQYYTDSNIYVSIPKLMPEVQSPRTVYFDRNIFVNAKECRPTVEPRINTQNYLTVPRSQQCSLANKADIYGMVHRGTQLICLCMNNNIKDLRVIDVV